MEPQPRAKEEPQTQEASVVDGTNSPRGSSTLDGHLATCVPTVARFVEIAAFPQEKNWRTFGTNEGIELVAPGLGLRTSAKSSRFEHAQVRKRSLESCASRRRRDQSTDRNAAEFPDAAHG